MTLKKTIFVLVIAGYVVTGFSNEPVTTNPGTTINNVTVPPPVRRFRPVSFLEQLSFGIKGGINFSLVFPINRYSIFTGSNPDQFDKTYNFFLENLGMHVGFIAMMDLTRNIKISFQPMLANYGYKYKTEYQWQGNTNLHYLAQYHQNLRMYEFPIIVGYYFRAQTWQPYVQGGAHYAFVSSSNTAVVVTETITNGGGTNSIVEYNSSVSSSSLYQKHHIGVLGGGGIQFLGERIHIGLEANYRFLFTKLNTTESRYSNNQVVSGYNDVADDIRFSNVAFTLNIIVPIQSRRKSSLPFCDY